MVQDGPGSSGMVSLISLSYSMPVFSANSFGLFIYIFILTKMRICLRNKDFDEIQRIGSFWVKAMKNLKIFEKKCKQTGLHSCCCLFTSVTFVFTE